MVSDDRRTFGCYIVTFLRIRVKLFEPYETEMYGVYKLGFCKAEFRRCSGNNSLVYENKLMLI